MVVYFLLPLEFLKFWYFDAPKEIILYLLSLNEAFFEQFSLPLLLRTFFRPIKNEYREGLIAFSIAMGMFVKFWLILFDLVLFMILLAIEIAIVAGFLVWPAATIYLLFMK